MNNDIRKLIDDNWEDIKELIAQKTEAEQKPKTIWGLETKDGEEYYRLYGDGDIVKWVFNTKYDEDARDIGNAFLTKEEAEFMRERRKIEAIMRKYSRPFKQGEYDYCIEYYHSNNTLNICCYSVTNYGTPYFETREMALKAIDEIGESKLKKYWFGVEE